MAVLLHTVTDSDIRGIKNSGAVNVSGSITKIVTTVVKHECHIGAAVVSVCTTLNIKNATAVKNDSRLCVPVAVVSRGKINGTVLKGQLTVVIEQDEVTCRIIGNVDGLTVKVDYDALTISYVEVTLSRTVKVAFESKIGEKSNGLTCARSIDSRLKIGILNAANLRNRSVCCA